MCVFALFEAAGIRCTESYGGGGEPTMISLGGGSAVIASPAFPLGYPGMSSCGWRVEAADNANKMRLELVEFDVSTVKAIL